MIKFEKTHEMIKIMGKGKLFLCSQPNVCCIFPHKPFGKPVFSKYPDINLMPYF